MTCDHHVDLGSHCPNRIDLPSQAPLSRTQRGASAKQNLARPLILAGILVALSGAASATQFGVTVNVVPCEGWECNGLTGNGSLEFSDLLMGALNIATINVAAVSPSVLTDGDVMSVSAPIQSVTGIFNTDTELYTATKVGTLGGATMTANALLPSGKKNAATTGGSLSLTNIAVDLTTQSIYANLTGANGVGTRNNQLIWHYGAIEGSTTFSQVPGITAISNKLSQLTITTEAFDLFAQSLGLTAFGKSSMAGIDDYGVMSAAVEVSPWSVYITSTDPRFLRPGVEVVVLPEPGTYALMGLGLVGIALAARRSRKRD